jgi:hypothetical protein
MTKLEQIAVVTIIASGALFILKYLTGSGKKNRNNKQKKKIDKKFKVHFTNWVNDPLIVNELQKKEIEKERKLKALRAKMELNIDIIVPKQQEKKVEMQKRDEVFFYVLKNVSKMMAKKQITNE